MSNQGLSRRDSYFLDNELEKYDPTKYYALVESKDGRKFLPPIGGVSEFDPSIAYSMIHVHGRAKIVGPGAADAPVIKVSRTKHTSSIIPVEATIEYTYDEIGAANARGADLENDTSSGALVSTEEQIDQMLAFGVPNTDIKGALNDELIEHTDALNKGSGPTDWLDPTASPDEIINDILLALSDVWGALKGARAPGINAPPFRRFGLALPPSRMIKLATRIPDTSETILEFIEKKLKRWIVGVGEWSALETADDDDPMGMLFPAISSGGGGDEESSFYMNPLCGGSVISQEFKLEMPQHVGRKVVIPTVAKCGGSLIRFPVACRYLKKI